MSDNKFEGLRQKAEALIGKNNITQEDLQKDMLDALHELSVYQAEIEMQNEELRDTQRRLQQTKNDYFELYEFAPIGYMNIDQRGIIMSVNLSAVKMFNLPRNKLLGRTFSEFVDKGFHDVFFRHMEAVSASTKTVPCELALHKPDNTPLYVRLESIYAGMTIRGEKTIRSAIIDMTELNRTRQQLYSLNTELEKRVAERNGVACKRLEQLKQLNLDLIRAEQRERRHLAEILHDDLQQILVGCGLHLSFLRKSTDEHQKEEFLSRTEETLKQAIEISRSLSHELYPPVLYHSGLAAALDWFSQQVRKLHGLTVQMCLNSQKQRFPKEIEIFLYQCARELLLNVAKHGKTDTARVNLDYQDGSILLCVADKGIGFDSESLFGKEDGFGLLNIKRRIETMGGTFEARAAQGKGCTVTLSLPSKLEARPLELELTEEGGEAEETETTAADETSAKRRKKGRIKVMLVDDHQILRRGLAQLLETQKDIAVIAEAGDGKTAVEKARTCKPHVVLMDIGMPGMDGINATGKILEENPDVRVIALTLHEEEWMVNQMLEAGAARYLTKNAPAEELIRAIRNTADAAETV